MRKRRTIRAAIATALISVGVVMPGINGFNLASASSFTMNCAGADNDVAAPGKTTKDLLGLLGQATVPLPVTVTPDLPGEVAPGADPFEAKLGYSLGFPADLLAQLKGPLLGLTDVTIYDISFKAEASGAGTGTLGFGPASRTYSLAGEFTVSETLIGTVTPTGVGTIFYRPGAMSLKIKIDKTVAGIALGSLTFVCTGSGVLATTTIKPEGAPNIVKNPIELSGPVGSTLSTDLLSNAEPDNLNPIVPETLEILEGPDGATLANGMLSLSSAEAGQQSVTYQVCGEPGVTEEIPGVSKTGTIKWGDNAYPGAMLNSHPISVTLSFKGEEVTIPISYVQNPFYPLDPQQYVPFDPNNGIAVLAHIITTDIRIPSAAQIQAALVTLPSINVGDVVVTGGPSQAAHFTALKNHPYQFTFGGQYANKADVPDIKVETFTSWAPQEWKSVLTSIPIPGGGGGGGGGGATPPTLEENFTLLLTGQISFDQFGQNIGDRVLYEITKDLDIPALLDQVLAMFPNPPEVTNVDGQDPVPPATVELCSQGVVNFAFLSDPTTTSTTTTTIAEVAPATTIKSRPLTPAG